MKQPTYDDAITWLAKYDDCTWLEDVDVKDTVITTTSAAMVRVLWGVSDDKRNDDLRKALAKVDTDHPHLRLVWTRAASFPEACSPS